MAQHKWSRYSGDLEKLFDDKGIESDNFYSHTWTNKPLLKNL